MLFNNMHTSVYKHVFFGLNIYFWIDEDDQKTQYGIKQKQK